jgi:hypothetical protein
MNNRQKARAKITLKRGLQLGPIGESQVVMEKLTSHLRMFAFTPCTGYRQMI